MGGGGEVNGGGGVGRGRYTNQKVISLIPGELSNDSAR